MRLTRRGRLLRTVVVVVLVGLLATYVVLRTPVGTLLGFGGEPPCTLTLPDEGIEWSAEQAMTATTTAGVGTRIGATVNGVAAAVSRSLARMERRDGERPVTPEAAREIYRRLPDVARPGRGSVAVAEALLGYHQDALTCVVALTDLDLPRQDPGPLGLTARADRVRVQMRAVHGKQILGGFEPRGVSSGHIEGSAHYEGRAIDVFFRPVTEPNRRLGWQQALWAVAHADRLDVATVIFDRRVWTATRSVQGWL